MRKLILTKDGFTPIGALIIVSVALAIVMVGISLAGPYVQDKWFLAGQGCVSGPSALPWLTKCGG